MLVTGASLAGGGGVWYFKFQTYHFAAVRDGVLYRDGNRDLREFVHAVERSHAKTVVSLIDDREAADPKKPQFAAEAAWCAEHGVPQVRIPVKLGGWPTAADVGRFLAVVQTPGNQPVLVHCAQGVRRTGMFVAAYELSIEHRSAAVVKADIQAFNHRTSDTDDVRTFIDLFRPESGELPATMPAASGE
jgi:protein tyrosine phosphatase (PTP) superfamily phosphohydrolase (DUF442 family)